MRVKKLEVDIFYSFFISIDHFEFLVEFEPIIGVAIVGIGHGKPIMDCSRHLTRT